MSDGVNVTEKPAGYYEKLKTKRARYRRERRAADRAAKGLPVQTGGGVPSTVWSPEMNARLLDLIEDGKRPGTIHRTREFPELSYQQIKGRWQGLRQRGKNNGGSVMHLGLELGCGPTPDPEQLEERDRRREAEWASDLHLDANHTILGDPSPERLAVARELDCRRTPRGGGVVSSATQELDPKYRPFSISAVRVSGPRNKPQEPSYAE